MYNYYSYGRPISCSICGSPGSTKTSCPLNPDSKNAIPERHTLAFSAGPILYHVPKSPSPVKKVHKSPSPVKPVSSDEIFFNSKSKNYYKLSNFFGGVEACYMKDRFKNTEIKELFDKFEKCDNKKFVEFLKILQPEKTDWTQAKLDYWFKQDGADKIPIKGILSKLVGTSVKDTPTGKRRLKILKGITGVEHIIINPNLSDEAKRALMFKCLRKKYKIKEYRDILLSTGDAILHEKPLRGSGDNWTYPGGDWLGQMLMTIRKEILSGKATS